ncbi:hypothetical protein C8Q80DRAFT_1176900 [Daedaleopsis nitida]|nr:hypothetical protein C8Q80DRAFT_1176900 [Daedaleopsis nitida]
MLYGFQLASIVLFIVNFVSAGIYGTFPIASSVLKAGRLNRVRWIDDGIPPSVQQVGRVKVDLYVGETYVETLADRVDPKHLSTDVWISPAWRHNGSDYHLRFVCQHPAITVYTAEFTITGMATLPPLDGPTLSSHNGSHPSIVYGTPPDTAVSTPKPSASKPLSTSVSTSPTPTSTSTVQDEDEAEGFGDYMRTHPANDAVTLGPRKKPTVDLERLKFRFVFVFWPTLIGITMAL